MLKRTHDIIPARKRTPVVILSPRSVEKTKTKHLVNIDGISNKRTVPTIRERWYYISSLIKKIKNTYSYREDMPVRETDRLDFLTLDVISRTGYSKYRTNFGLIVVSLVLLLTLNLFSAYGKGISTKDTIFFNINSGYTNVLEAKNKLFSIEPAQAELNFTSAYSNFQDALSDIEQINAGVSLFDGSPLDTSGDLLRAGEKLSLAGIYASKSVSEIMDNQNYNAALVNLEQVINNVLSAEEDLASVQETELPESYRAQFTSIKSQLASMTPTLKKISDDIPTLKRIFGDDYPRRYFIAFQNTYESRGLGGFLGSYGILDFEEGKITNLSVHDVYDIDWQLFEDVPAPEGLKPFMNTVKLRDANYLPDTAKAAEYIRWFYEHSGGTSFDGLIVIDQIYLEKLLELTGPIELPDYGITLTSENYFDILQYDIETSKEDVSGPKQILKDLSPLLMEKMKTIDYTAAMPTMLELLRDKHFSLYFFEEDLQQVAKEWNLTQSVYDGAENIDYLSVVHTNIGGNKTDRYITEEYTHATEVQTDGSIQNTLTITLKHTFSNTSRDEIYSNVPDLYNLSYAEQNRILFILGDSPYKDFIRVYVPQESVLKTTEGIDIRNLLIRPELNKTYYGFHIELEPGETQTYTLTYTLPFSYNTYGDNAYEFVAQKQFGRKEATLHKSIQLAPQFGFEYSSPDSTQTKNLDILMQHDQYIHEPFHLNTK